MRDNNWKYKKIVAEKTENLRFQTHGQKLKIYKYRELNHLPETVKKLMVPVQL